MSAVDKPFGRPVRFTPPPAPPREAIHAPWVILEPLDPDRHASAIFEHARGADGIWDYMGYGPFPDAASYAEWMHDKAMGGDPAFYAILDAARPQAGALGLAAFLRIDRNNGVIEVGHILMPPALQRTRTGSAAIMAMIGWAFGAGYRRVEWKCDDLNAASRRAALRFGFTYEGTFRNHMIYKGRNRDTAWFAITDQEWPIIKARYDAWLAPENFDADGRQRKPLATG